MNQSITTTPILLHQLIIAVNSNYTLFISAQAAVLNERFSEAESQCNQFCISAQDELRHSFTLDDSDVSTDETKGAQWSFVAPNKDVEDET
ncbi:hypothetical protein PAAG_12333 [Paracoccidioides lutzii Pb01]|uniref:Uncharacterized protein n=1 Tax=Paracoccidioides lutzii (strain ATCC MYA-826 / Pb01) TaxID=502779 RepID=A0A0A2UZE9_PARBA|nr:hypothetical protein PAAG_12333 [Paracoccidioides lutzii Pb01]KGQ00961.1 hypothetical protein PAAG_12333 [Paracoccidioides lutzii Pb01]